MYMRMSNPERWADPDCDLCGGAGEVSVWPDDSDICECAAERRAQAEADSREDEWREQEENKPNNS